MVFKIIEQRRFSKWKMKYVARYGTIKTYLSDLGVEVFNPAELDEESISFLIDVLIHIEDQA